MFNLTNTITYSCITNRGYTANGFSISPAAVSRDADVSSSFPKGRSAAQASIRIDFEQYVRRVKKELAMVDSPQPKRTSAASYKCSAFKRLYDLAAPGCAATASYLDDFIK